MGRAAFLIGLLVVPALLLWLGHRLRDRSPAQRGAFWGGVIGHTIAIIVAVTLLHYPPVMWTGEIRAAIAMWVMLLGALAGAAMGAVRAVGRARELPR
ncbi:MAG TPA: hypothetical protein VHG09_09240 [Longimicrobiales bacterium]|nr:hypothetical protein [Longimicrobiales bacterium]